MFLFTLYTHKGQDKIQYLVLLWIFCCSFIFMKLDNDLIQLVLITVAVNYPSVNLEIRSFWF